MSDAGIQREKCSPCPQQFREDLLPDCSLPQHAGLGQGPGREPLRAVRPAHPSSLGELESPGGLSFEEGETRGCTNLYRKWMRQESWGPRGAVGAVRGHNGPVVQ